MVKLSNDHSLAALSLVQDVRGCGGILYVDSDVVLQHPSRLKGISI